MNKWDTRFMAIAKEVSSWSKDPNNQVGAVLVTPRRHIISTGYNGLPAGIDRVPANRKEKLFKTIHAEINCLLHASSGPAGNTMYITRHPCAQCAATMIQAGIAWVVCPQPELKSTWSDSMITAVDLFAERCVEVTYI